MNRMLKGTIVAVCGTQQDFGKRMGWSELKVSKVVNGRRQVTPREQARIAQVLGVPKHILFPERERA